MQFNILKVICDLFSNVSIGSSPTSLCRFPEPDLSKQMTRLFPTSHNKGWLFLSDFIRRSIVMWKLLDLKLFNK